MKKRSLHFIMAMMVVLLSMVMMISFSYAETEGGTETDVLQEEEIEIEEPQTEQIVIIDYLDAPVITISNSSSSGKPRLEWDAVDGAEKYEIYRALTKNGVFEKIFATRKTIFTNTSTEPGVRYYYKVIAVSDNPSIGQSEFSNRVSRLCDLARPKVKISNRASDGKIRLTWDKIEGASNYVVYRTSKKNGTYKKWYTTKKNYVVNFKAKTGQKFYYKVKAIYADKSNANSALSKTVYRTCDLPQPVISVSTTLSGAKPRITWKKVAGASKYVVYRATSKNGTYTKKCTTTSTSYTNTGAKAGKRYYYKVKAIYGKKSAANSAYSEVKSCRCGQPYIVSSTDRKYTYKDFKSDMDKLVKKYPKYLSKHYLGKTADDRGLYYLVLGNPDAEKQIFVTAGFHAREYINCQVTMRLIEYYCRNYTTKSYEDVKYANLFDEVSFCILPMVNPDGIQISAYGPDGINDAKLRKKIRKMDRNGRYSNWKANARGVDLNNNYIIYKGKPIADDYCSEGYPGPKRYSEKETKAVRAAMDECSNIKAVINYHSMGRVIYWGYHSKKYKAECWDFAELFHDMTGYYMIDESYSTTARGDFEHYIMHEYKIPYVCIENGKGSVPVPNSEFASIYYKNRLGFAKAAYHYY